MNNRHRHWGAKVLSCLLLLAALAASCGAPLPEDAAQAEGTPVAPPAEANPIPPDEATITRTATPTTATERTATVTATPAVTITASSAEMGADRRPVLTATARTTAARPAPSPTPTAAVTVTSAPEPTATRAPTDAPAQSLAVWEQSITLTSYGWQDALQPTAADDPIYPYPRLNFDAVGGPAPRSYTAVFLQNDYVQAVVVPELGGRILRWTDRTTGRQLCYANPVIKPTRWGYRGWWLATGGIEWAFPVNEHGLNEYRPWSYERLWNGVRVWDVDDRTGLRIEIIIQIEADGSALIISPRLSNPTSENQRFQFWINGMLTLSDANAPSAALTFVLPDDAVTVHSTGDGSLPAAGASMGWPVHNGRDFSRYAEWRQYLGIFADPARSGFVGAYDMAADQGMVRAFPETTATGVKIFCLGDLPADLWTDDGSRYFELWGGYTPTFWDDAMLPSAKIVGWTERWYPVSGIGGYNWANEHAAIRLTPQGESVELAVAAASAFEADIALRRGGVEVQRWPARIAPDAPFTATSAPAPGEGDWGVQVLAGDEIIAQMGP
jgi:hypothetical protein